MFSRKILLCVLVLNLDEKHIALFHGREINKCPVQILSNVILKCRRSKEM